jgi:prepilin-type N-terminal cleavage/methylation domain-containing protein
VKTEAGFSLLETLVAVTILSIGVGALVQLSVIAAGATRRARAITTASVLAQQKMEQLRALAWKFDPAGRRVSDLTSDTSATPEAPTGGTGLRVSPAESLAVNTAGYCDFVDASGRLLRGGRGGSVAPANTLYIRRWSIARVSAAPDDTIAIQVLVTMIGGEHAGESARLVSVRTRRGL